MSQIKRVLASAALLAGTVGCLAAAPASAVVEGVAVAPSAVPWFASLGGCGGTLVAPDRVLTAAHCVRNLSPAMLRYVGVGTEGRTPTHIAMHPNWRARNGTNFLDDVAIVELDAPVTGVPLVKLGGGPDPAQALILGTGLRFAPGTGHSEAAMFGGGLRTAPLRTIDDAACAKAFKGYKPADGERFDARMRCSIDADGMAPLYSGCKGDSGGPLWTRPATAPVQLGVVSWGGNRAARTTRRRCSPTSRATASSSPIRRRRGRRRRPAPPCASPAHAASVDADLQGQRLYGAARGRDLPLLGDRRRRPRPFRRAEGRRPWADLQGRQGGPRPPCRVLRRGRQRRRLHPDRSGQHGRQALSTAPIVMTGGRQVVFLANSVTIEDGIANPKAQKQLESLVETGACGS